MRYEYQVIRYCKNAHVCHDQIRSLGYFFTKPDADSFAGKQDCLGGEIIVRKAH